MCMNQASKYARKKEKLNEIRTLVLEVFGFDLLVAPYGNLRDYQSH